MEGLGVQTSVGVGILVGACDLSSNITQTTTGIASFSGSSTQDANFTADSNAVLVLGTRGLGYEASFTKTTTAVATFVGSSTQDFNIAKTANGEILWENLNTDAQTESWTNLTTNASNENWTDLNTATNNESWTDLTR